MSAALELRRWGSGAEPVLFIHGFTGAGSTFDHLESLLGKSLSAAAIDLPGHGASPVAVNGGDGWNAAVESIASAIERAHGGAAHLIGYSMGVRLALAVAVRFPSLVRSLILESGSPGLRTEEERAGRRAHDEASAA